MEKDNHSSEHFIRMKKSSNQPPNFITQTINTKLRSNS
jgi:hypothetical protein